MKSENDLINKLMISKKIMERHDTMKRGQVTESSIPDNIQVENFNVPSAKYDIPTEYLMESQPTTFVDPKKSQMSSKDKILSSKLPDEIKMLMINHPIQQPQLSSTATLSNELVEKASRLMNVNAKGEIVNSAATKKTNVIKENVSTNNDYLKSLIKETVREVLQENGLLVESTSKTNEIFSFRVGEHIFEGKLTKIKKVLK
jgi:hypothetical protein